MKALVETLVRAVIAAIVLTITGYLTWDRASIAQEWQAVFVMVVAYYFTDRPQADRLRRGDMGASMPAVRLELLTQFVLAMLLLFATVVFFTVQHPDFPNEVAGAWLGGVTVAIAFYFKPNESSDVASSDEHDFLRAALAIGVGISTMIIFGLRHAASVDPKLKVNALPLQWVALAFIVIAFYFKQRDAQRVNR